MLQLQLRYALIGEPVTEEKVRRAILRQAAEHRGRLVEIRVPDTAPELPGEIEEIPVKKSCNCSPGALTYVEHL